LHAEDIGWPPKKADKNITANEGKILTVAFADQPEEAMFELAA